MFKIVQQYDEDRDKECTKGSGFVQKHEIDEPADGVENNVEKCRENDAELETLELYFWKGIARIRENTF